MNDLNDRLFDLVNKVRISLREMRESNYWLRIINGIKEIDQNNKELNFMIIESDELKTYWVQL